MELKKLLYLALGAAVLLMLVLWLWPSETKRVRKVFSTVSHEIHKRGREESMVISAAKAKALANLVAQDATFDLEGRLQGTFGGRPLVQQIIMVRGQAERIEIGFADLAIDFLDKRTASATGDVYLSGLSDALGLAGRDARALETVLEKDAEDGKWRFTLVRILPIVEK